MTVYFSDLISWQNLGLTGTFQHHQSGQLHCGAVQLHDVSAAATDQQLPHGDWGHWLWHQRVAGSDTGLLPLFFENKMAKLPSTMGICGVVFYCEKYIWDIQWVHDG